MDFRQLVAERYASRKYDGVKIHEDKISQLKELIRLAPSALNLQPWKIKIISDGHLKEVLTPMVFGGRTHIPTCSHLLVTLGYAADEPTPKSRLPEGEIFF